MFTKIGVENFKLFKNPVEFELKPITVLTGPNNCGKSTFNDFLYLLSNSYKPFIPYANEAIITDIEILYFDQNLRDQIGGNILNNKSKSKSLIFHFTFLDDIGLELKTKLSYSFTKNKLDYTYLPDSKVGTQLDRFEINYNNKRLLSLDLVDPEDYFFNDYERRLSLKLAIWEPLFDLKEAKVFRNYIIDYRSKSSNLKQEHYPIVERSRSNRRNMRRGLDIGEPNTKPDDYKRHLINFLTSENREIIIDSFFINDILSDKAFFRKTHKKEGYYQVVKKELNEKGIKNRKDFLKAVKDFEEQFIHKSIIAFFSDINTKIEHPIDGDEVDDMDLNQIFSENQVKDISESDLSDFILSINNPLSIPIVMYFMEEDIESKKRLNDLNCLNWLYKFTQYTIIDFYDDILSDLLDTVSNSGIHYYRQTQNIKSKYLFGDKDLDNSSAIGYGRLMQWAEEIKKRNKIANTEFEKFKNLQEFKSTLPVLERSINFINDWIIRLEIGDELMMNPINIGEETIGISYYVRKGKEKLDIENLGLGFQKLILILLSIGDNAWSSFYSEPQNRDKENTDEINPLEDFYNSKIKFYKTKEYEDEKIILLEEPEANLHPSLQSKLAELIVDAYLMFDLRFVIETHSEYLIRKFQYLIASKSNALKPENIAVHYMHNPDNIPKGEKQVYVMDIREDGFMNNDFGKGFFDEASSLSLRLLNLPNFN